MSTMLRVVGLVLMLVFVCGVNQCEPCEDPSQIFCAK